MSRSHDILAIIKLYRQQTGEIEYDMADVVKFAVSLGMKLPNPADPYAILEAQFSQAARIETKTDEVTGQPFRVYHAIKEGQRTFWMDIDEAPRKKMRKSLISRREQMVSDGVQLTLDKDHWNRVHPDEEPIFIPLDFTEDVNERKSGGSAPV